MSSLSQSFFLSSPTPKKPKKSTSKKSSKRKSTTLSTPQHATTQKKSLHAVNGTVPGSTWNERFHTNEMPLYNPKNDHYLHKRVPIDSFGANGKLEPITTKRTGEKATASGTMRRKSHVVMGTRPKSQAASRKRHSHIGMQHDVAAGMRLHRPSTSHDIGFTMRPRIGNLVDFDQDNEQLGLFTTEGSLPGIQSPSFDARSAARSISPADGILFTRVNNHRPSSSSSRITEMIEESSNQMLFSDLRSNLRKLWSELHIPDADRLTIIVNHFRDATNENIDVLQQEVLRLLSQRATILRVLRCIGKREEAVQRLTSMCESFQMRGTSNRILFGTQIQDVLQLIRYTTLEAVEAIVAWKQLLKTDKPFMWKSQNYLERIKTDTKWFEESEVAQMMREMDMDTGALDFAMVSKRRPISANLTPIKRQPAGPLQHFDSSHSLHSDALVALSPASLNYRSQVAPIFTGDSPLSLVPNAHNDELSEDVLQELESIGFIPPSSLHVAKQSPVAAHGFTKRRLHSSIFRSRLSILENQNLAATTIQLAWRCFQARKAVRMRWAEVGMVQQAVITLQLLYRRWKGAQLFALQRQRYYATVIQTCWRCFKARNCLRQLQQKQKELDAREMEESDGEINPFLDETPESRTTFDTTQPSVRPSCEAQSKVESKSESPIDQPKTPTIEPAKLGVQTQSANTSPLMDMNEVQKQIRQLQATYRSTAASQEATIAVQRDSELCTLVQSAIRQILAQKILAESLEAMHETQMLQSQKEKEKHAAHIFQLVVRSFLAHEETKALIMEHNNTARVMLVQRCMLRLQALVQLQQRRHEIQEVKDAVYLQSLAKTVLARARIESLRQERQYEFSILYVQSIIRALQVREKTAELRRAARHQLDEQAKRVLNQFLVQHIARRLIQSNDGTTHVDPQIAKQMRLEQAALTIQCCVRVWLAKRQREPARAAKESINQIAAQIQALWKGFKVRSFVLPQKRTEFRQKLKLYLDQERAVGIVVQAWQVQKARLALKQRAHCLQHQGKYAAITLQCFARRILALQRVRCLRQERDEYLKNLLQREAASYVIQRTWHAYQAKLAAKECAREIVLVTRALPVLQRVGRCYLARKTVRELREARQRSNEEFLQQERASITIQCAYRHHRARTYVSNSIQTKRYTRAVIVLQRAVRAWLVRMAHIRRAQQERAAIVIQMHARSALVRLNLYNAAAVKIQRTIRQHSVKTFQKQFKLDKIRKNIAARIIQQAWLAHKTNMIHAIEDKVLLVQCAIRRNDAQHQLHQLVISASNAFADAIMGQETKEAAAICIQLAFKSYRARKYLDLLRLEKKKLAALRIQLAVRKMIASRRLRMLVSARTLSRLQKHREEGLIFWMQCVARTAIVMRSNERELSEFRR